jgi:hypothetical protein
MGLEPRCETLANTFGVYYAGPDLTPGLKQPWAGIIERRWRKSVILPLIRYASAGSKTGCGLLRDPIHRLMESNMITIAAIMMIAVRLTLM